MSETMTGAEMVIRALQDQGVDTLFGYPGGAVLPIYDAMFQQKKVKHVLVRHEQGAVHAAEGYARNDQLVLNSFFFLRLRNAQLLRQDRFPNGSLVFKETGFERPNLDMSKVVLVHANWMEGLPLKTKALKAAGYWHL